jgi:hypothetical protein
MKTRLVVAFVGLAISFASPAFAQQSNMPNHSYLSRLSHSLKKLTMRLTSVIPPHLSRDTRITGFW